MGLLEKKRKEERKSCSKVKVVVNRREKHTKNDSLFVELV